MILTVSKLIGVDLGTFVFPKHDERFKIEQIKHGADYYGGQGGFRNVVERRGEERDRKEEE